MSRVDDQSVHLRVFGDTTNPVLVMLHGWGMSGDIFAPLLDQLSDHFYVVVPDLPGLGRSDAIVGQAVTPVVVAERLMKSISVILAGTADQSAIVLGWSLGGNIAAQIAVDYPEQVTCVVLVASNPCFVERQDWPLAMSAETYYAFADSLAANPVKTLQRFASLQVQGDPQGRSLLKEIKTLLAALEPPQLAEMLALLELDGRTIVSQISQPVLQVFGGADALVPVALAQELPGLYPTHQITIISESAHLPFLSDSEQFIQRLREFSVDVKHERGQ